MVILLIVISFDHFHPLIKVSGSERRQLIYWYTSKKVMNKPIYIYHWKLNNCFLVASHNTPMLCYNCVKFNMTWFVEEYCVTVWLFLSECNYIYIYICMIALCKVLFKHIGKMCFHNSLIVMQWCVVHIKLCKVSDSVFIDMATAL